MILIKKSGTRISKKGNKIRYGVFLCPFCNKEVERQMGGGKSCKSCGCQQHSEEVNRKISIAKKGKTSNNKGKPMLEKQKQKISMTNKGKKRTEEQNKRQSDRQKEFGWNKGKTNVYSEKTIKQMSETHKKYWLTMQSINHRDNISGENNWNWNNGSSFEPYSSEFNKDLRQFIKQRDFNICQTPNCMNTENLHIHHINYNKKDSSLENLTTLCNSCHSKTNGKSDRAYWTKFYFEITNLYL